MMLRGIIFEFDMFCSNISLMKKLEMISLEVYLEMLEAPKKIRNELIGKISIGEKDFWKRINEARDIEVKEFIKINKIPKDNIIEIVNDAIWVYNLRPNKLKTSDFIRFRCKSNFTSMLTINNSLKLYKNSDGLTCRGGKINKDHDGFDLFLNLYILMEMNSNKKTSFKILKKLETVLKDIKDEKRLISTCTNKDLLDILRREL